MADREARAAWRVMANEGGLVAEAAALRSRLRNGDECGCDIECSRCDGLSLHRRVELAAYLGHKAARAVLVCANHHSDIPEDHPIFCKGWHLCEQLQDDNNLSWLVEGLAAGWAGATRRAAIAAVAKVLETWACDGCLERGRLAEELELYEGLGHGEVSGDHWETLEEGEDDRREDLEDLACRCDGPRWALEAARGMKTGWALPREDAPLWAWHLSLACRPGRTDLRHLRLAIDSAAREAGEKEVRSAICSDLCAWALA